MKFEKISLEKFSAHETAKDLRKIVGGEGICWTVIYTRCEDTGVQVDEEGWEQCDYE